jgi:hypothetical protein
MDLDTVSPDVFGASLSGIGLNLLVADTIAQAAFLEAVFAMQKYRLAASSGSVS